MSSSLLAFVAGATGYTGREVVRELAHQWIPTIAHVRPDSPATTRWKNHFISLGAEVDFTEWKLSEMTATFRERQPSHVFCLLGTTRSRMKQSKNARKNDYEAIDYGLTSLLLKAARKAAIQPRFIYLSSVGAGGWSPNAYMKARQKTEKEIRESGFPYIIARPSFITGPDRDEKRVGEAWAAKAGDSFLHFMGSLGLAKLRDRYRSTTNSQLAKALVTLGLDEQKENRIYESEDLR